MDINKSMCLTRKFGKLQVLPYDLVATLERSTKASVEFQRSLNRYMDNQNRRK